MTAALIAIGLSLATPAVDEVRACEAQMATEWTVMQSRYDALGAEVAAIRKASTAEMAVLRANRDTWKRDALRARRDLARIRDREMRQGMRRAVMDR